MKTDNLMGGRYLAEITHELFSDLRDTKYQHSEPRLSIYGRAPDEWTKLASWAVEHKIYSDNVRWLIQVPRLYSVYRKLGTVESFQVRVRLACAPFLFFSVRGAVLRVLGQFAVSGTVCKCAAFGCWRRARRTRACRWRRISPTTWSVQPSRLTTV